MKINILCLFILFYHLNYAQKLSERSILVKEYDQKKNRELVKEVKENKKSKEKLLVAYLKKNPFIPKRFEKEGVTYELIDIRPSGKPLYYRTFNQGSSHTIKAASLNTGGSLNLDVNGEEMTAGVWDGGRVKPSHIEFPGNKVFTIDGVTNDLDHATHVAGTIAAVGAFSGNIEHPPGYTKGMASAAAIASADWNNDVNEITAFANLGFLVSNHSYGYGIESVDLWQFGAYNDYSYFFDRIAETYPNYQIVAAAGNDREKASIYNPTKGGYELTTGFSNSKNILTVAAVEELLNYTDPSQVKIASFSNFGPTDDGRIKPNISAKGIHVFSPIVGDNNSSYGHLDGTSMSTPAITGSILLLQQHYNNINKKFMKSATVRGLLQHTALEAGLSPGPDYSFGWGLANIEEAANLISNKDENLIEENTLSEGVIYEKTFSATGGEDIRVSISWTDLANENYNEGEIDPQTKYLVNDLDIKVIDDRGNEYYPWKLDGRKPSAAATNNSTNDVDNFERIDIAKAEGRYRVIVSHKGSLVGGKQDYTLIITSSTIDTNNIDKAQVYPNPASDFIRVIIKEPAKFFIYDMGGKLLSSGDLSAGFNSINVSDFLEGVYLLKLGNGSKVDTRQILIK